MKYLSGLIVAIIIAALMWELESIYHFGEFLVGWISCASYCATVECIEKIKEESLK